MFMLYSIRKNGLINYIWKSTECIITKEEGLPCLDGNIYEHRDKVICSCWNMLRHCSIEQQIVDNSATIHNGWEFLLWSFECIDFLQFLLRKLWNEKEMNIRQLNWLLKDIQGSNSLKKYIHEYFCRQI